MAGRWPCWTQLWKGESTYASVLIYAPYLIGSLRIPYTNAGNNSADGTNLPVFIANESLGGTDVPAGASVQMLFRRLGVTSGAPGTASCTLTGHMYAAP